LVNRYVLPLALAAATLARGEPVTAQPANPAKQPANPAKQPEDTAKQPLPDTAALERRLTDAVRRSPDSFEAHHALAGFYLHHGKLELAIPHLERARAIDPAHYAVGYDLAVALLQTGRLTDAREQVGQMLKAKETAELHNLLGDIEERAGDLVPAAEAYQRAAHMDATEEHLFDFGNNLLQLRAFEPATEVFTTAIARYPRSARLHVGIGIAQYSRGHYRDAVQSMCTAVDIDPADSRPYQFLGEMYGVSPELAGEVTNRLEQFVKTQPRNALAHLHYGLSLWKGQPESPQPADVARIEALLRRAVALDPSLARGYLQLGILLSEQRRYKEAIQELRHAARLEPDLAQVHYRLAQAYQRTGQTALAAKEMELFERFKATAR
jgi:tetratricopeptide (TPR) repeat protein